MPLQRILGIDPGSRITGYGLIDHDGFRSQYVASGCIHVGDIPWPARLGQIFHSLRDIVAHYQPMECAVEQVFVAHNVATALKLGQARGAALCAVLSSSGATVHEYAARAVKLAIVGNGNAEKNQVAYMVKILLSLHDELAEDQTDALAIALCHAHHLNHLTAPTTSWRNWRP